MGAEKVAALNESWNAMAMQAVRANQTLTAAWLRSIWSFSPARLPSHRAGASVQRATLDILSKGLAPVHRKATANAKRLGRIRS